LLWFHIKSAKVHWILRLSRTMAPPNPKRCTLWDQGLGEALPFTNSMLLCASAYRRPICWVAPTVSFARKRLRSAHFQTRPFAWLYFRWSLGAT